MIASKAGDADIVRLLLHGDEGAGAADVDAVGSALVDGDEALTLDGLYHTALVDAVLAGHTEIAELLLQHGARRDVAGLLERLESADPTSPAARGHRSRRAAQGRKQEMVDLLQRERGVSGAASGAHSRHASIVKLRPSAYRPRP